MFCPDCLGEITFMVCYNWKYKAIGGLQNIEMNSLILVSHLKCHSYLYLSLVCEGKSLLEYCFDRVDKSPSPLLLPPLAGSNVGLAAVVILLKTTQSL